MYTLFVEETQRRGAVNFYLEKDEGNTITVIGYDGENIVNNKIDKTASFSTEKLQPLFSVPSFMKDDVLRLFAKEAETRNLRTEEDSMLKGKLGSMELHLNDMRDISKHLLKMNKQ